MTCFGSIWWMPGSAERRKNEVLTACQLLNEHGVGQLLMASSLAMAYALTERRTKESERSRDAAKFLLPKRRQIISKAFFYTFPKRLLQFYFSDFTQFSVFPF